MKFQRIGPTGLLRVGTMMTIGGMTNDRRAVMVNGEFRRHGGTMVLDGMATGMDIPGNRDQSKVRNRVQVNRSDVQKTGSVGSMIINPLLFDMTCETTGGLRFVHEHEFVLTWKPRIGLWLIAKTLKVNSLTRFVCWQEVATAVLVSQKS